MTPGLVGFLSFDNGFGKVFRHRFSARAGGVNDGVIFDTADPHTLAKWKRSGLPRVQVMDSGEPFSVNYDEQRIGALAAEHLHGTGKRLVALGSPAETKPTWLGPRVAGFCRWAREHHLPVETFRLGGGLPYPGTPFGKSTPVPRIARWV